MLPYVDSDLLPLPEQWLGIARLGGVWDVDANRFIYLTVPKQTGWMPYVAVQELLEPSFDRVAALARLMDRRNKRKRWWKSASINMYDGRQHSFKPVMCCALDLKAFAEQQLDDQLPTGQHNVIVAMYGGWHDRAQQYVPVAVVVAALVVKTEPELDGTTICFDRSWFYAPLPHDVLEAVEASIVIE